MTGSEAIRVPVRRRRTLTMTSSRGTAMHIVALSCLMMQMKFQCGDCFAPSDPRSSSLPRRQLPNDARARPQYASQHTHSTTRISGSNNDDNDGDWLQQVDDFLDKPFFDPDDQVAKDEEEGEGGGVKSWFARLVINDYATAEALYAGLFFSVLLLATQEALRYYMYGVDYVPFTRGGGGKLF